MSKKKLSLGLLLSLHITQIFSWWDAGHMVIAQMARNLLDKKVKEKVDMLINASHDDSVSDCNTFVTASVWSDLISEHMRTYWDFHSQPYPFFSQQDDELVTPESLKKFIYNKLLYKKKKTDLTNEKTNLNQEKTESVIQKIYNLTEEEKELTPKEIDDLVQKRIDSLTKEEYETIKKDACSKIKMDAYSKNKKAKLISGLNSFIQTLKNIKTPNKIKGEALRWVLHLVGDIHQPLHCSSLYSSQFTYGDFLGCQVKITPPTTEDNKTPEATSLHKVWDSAGCIFEPSGFRLPLTEDKKEKVKKIAQDLIKEHPIDTLSELKKETGPFDWAVESSTLAHTVAYKNVIHNGTLSKEYIDMCQEICKKRMALAGHRLAGLLNTIFAEKNEQTTSTRTKRKRSTATTSPRKRRKLTNSEEL